MTEPWTNVGNTDANITEQDIQYEFLHKDMSLLDAILALQKCGYDEREAERIVFEWVDGLESTEESEYDEEDE